MEHQQKRFFLVALVVLMPVLAVAQSGSMTNQKTKWMSDAGIDLVSGDTITAEVIFTAVDSQTVQLNTGKFTQTLSVTGTTGTWSNLSQQGSITYYVMLHDTSGTMLFKREASGVSIMLDMSNAEGGIRHQYFIHSLQVIN